MVLIMLTACTSVPDESGQPDNGTAAPPTEAPATEQPVEDTPVQPQTQPPETGELPLTMPGAGFTFDDAPAPEFINVSVHDPSVFPAGDGTYYVMGSHLAVAKTTDFIKWQQVTADWRGRQNSFYPADNSDPAVQTMQQQSEDVLRGAENALGFFAGDIHRMPDGRFFQYYCLTASWKCSAIGVAISDSGPEGPYVTSGLFVRSAMAGENKTPDGSDTWTERRYPNCIDPQAFFDRDGIFWMVYGSWSGGIFIMEIDQTTGMPVEDSEINKENGGYGRVLITGSHASIEGPYIIYSPESEYYYLFVSYGGLASSGGYNIRVFRSRSVTGPYEDGKLADAAEKRVTNPGAQEYGVKLMGSYQFRLEEGETGRTTGYLSPGHNSVLYDSDTERYLVIFHQRFTGRGEVHEVRVHEMFINVNGWPVIAPYRYDGGTVRTFTQEQLTGSWKLINHQRNNNPTAYISRTMHFLADGTVAGEWEGTWELGSDGKTARITLGTTVFDGVFLRCWDHDNGMWVQALTALSADGRALWGSGVALG